MSDKKAIKRSIKAVWDKVRELRAERAKHYGPVDVKASAETLASLADELNELANQSSALRAMPPVEPETQPKARKKAKKAAAAGE